MNTPARAKYARIKSEITKKREELRFLRAELAHMFLDTGEVKSVDEALFLVGRKRDRDFLAMLLRNLGQGMPMEDAAEDSIRRNFDTYALADRSSVLKRAKTKLDQPDIANAFERAMEVVGFKVSDAVEAYVGHIKGTHTKEVIGKDGEVVELRVPPNFAAAKDALDRFIPKDPVRVQVQQTNMNVDVAQMMREAERGDDAPMLRRVGPPINTDAMLEADEDDDTFPTEKDD